MRTAVDSSVLLDVLLNDPKFVERSKAALRQATNEGVLIVCEVVVAEISPAIPDGRMNEFLNSWKLQFVPSSQKSALLAGEMFRSYLQRRTISGTATLSVNRGRVVADFLIAAHGQFHADRFLARDRGYYRDYFNKLVLWDFKGTN